MRVDRECKASAIIKVRNLSREQLSLVSMQLPFKFSNGVSNAEEDECGYAFELKTACHVGQKGNCEFCVVEGINELRNRLGIEMHTTVTGDCISEVKSVDKSK